ncbi:hypothetical protein CEXT_246901 [Caerostris extrusa]|uniref:Uncharacterized protein n=1 Tax=Caerostris extrusa TaxID=172846 RepID=A0AAV4UY51_CAEEX|nr:hypothetical protein CEXT_246901 [Caerostris extrusa]
MHTNVKTSTAVRVRLNNTAVDKPTAKTKSVEVQANGRFRPGEAPVAIYEPWYGPTEDALSESFGKGIIVPSAPDSIEFCSLLNLIRFWVARGFMASTSHRSESRLSVDPQPSHHKSRSSHQVSKRILEMTSEESVADSKVLSYPYNLKTLFTLNSHPICTIKKDTEPKPPEFDRSQNGIIHSHPCRERYQKYIFKKKKRKGRNVKTSLLICPHHQSLKRRDCYSTFRNPKRKGSPPSRLSLSQDSKWLAHLTHACLLCAAGKSPESLMCHRRMSIVDALSAFAFLLRMEKSPCFLRSCSHS